MKDDDSDNAILSWQQSCLVNNVTTDVEPQPHSKPTSSSNPKKRVAPLIKLENQTPSFVEEWKMPCFLLMHLSRITCLKMFIRK